MPPPLGLLSSKPIQQVTDCDRQPSENFTFDPPSPRRRRESLFVCVLGFRFGDCQFWEVGIHNFEAKERDSQRGFEKQRKIAKKNRVWRENEAMESLSLHTETETETERECFRKWIASKRKVCYFIVFFFFVSILQCFRGCT
jgi:hypothetical protein